MASGAIVEKVDPNTGISKKFRVIEIPVDPPNTVIRRLVPLDTTDDDVPEGARLMNDAESQGILQRQSTPENIRVGDRVRLRTETGSTEAPVDGTVDAKYKTGKFHVRFENGTVGRYEAKELTKVH